jgi:hypothetical protein
MAFIQSESRLRHAYIERSLDNTINVLSTPEAAKILGKMATDRVRFIEDSYAVANIRHGAVSIESLTESQVPIIAIPNNEPIKIGSEFQKQTPIQLKSMRAFFNGGSGEPNPVVDRVISQLAPTLGNGDLIIGTANALALSLSDTFDFSSLTNSDKSLLYQVHARPMMVLRYREDAHRVNPSTIVHETEHVLDVLRTPVYEAPKDGDWTDSRLREELRAYHIQALTLRVMEAMGYYPKKNEYLPVKKITPDGRYISDILTIDQLRQQANEDRKDKFYPSQDLKDILGKLGLDKFYTSKTGGSIK